MDKFYVLLLVHPLFTDDMSAHAGDNLYLGSVLRLRNRLRRLLGQHNDIVS